MLQFSSPGKMKYKTQKAVKKTLVIKGMEKCLRDSLASASSSEESQTEDPEFMPSNKGEETKESQMNLRKGEEMERRLFVCESSPLIALVQQINDTSKYCTSDCNGKFLDFFSIALYFLTYFSEVHLSRVAFTCL